MSSRELTEWAVYEREYGPLGPERGDWQAALVAHTVASSGGVKSKITEFLLRWGGHKKQSLEDQMTILRAIASRGGRLGDDS